MHVLLCARSACRLRPPLLYQPRGPGSQLPVGMIRKSAACGFGLNPADFQPSRLDSTVCGCDCATLLDQPCSIQSAACGLKSSLYRGCMVHGVAACARHVRHSSAPLCAPTPPPPSLAAPARPVAHEAGTERSPPASPKLRRAVLGVTQWKRLQYTVIIVF
jgi:hypothetical protein